jgi:SpoIID/LytB domain protein
LEEDLGPIRALEAVERGLSGRLVKLRIRGEKKTLVVGKELEIRRVLSRSHLYSSAFVVRTEAKDGDRVPDSFLLIGAGWGHGVGLCQIGAAVLADSGRSHEEILAHYFRGADLRELY